MRKLIENKDKKVPAVEEEKKLSENKDMEEIDVLDIKTEVPEVEDEKVDTILNEVKVDNDGTNSMLNMFVL